MTQIARTVEEIVAKIDDVADSDFFGVMRSRLVGCLDYSSAKPYLNDDATEKDFDEVRTKSREDLVEDAKDYMDFAITKMLYERGLSANRSVDHYRAIIWLATDDETSAKYDATEYGWYGRNQLEEASRILGFHNEFLKKLEEASE